MKADIKAISIYLPESTLTNEDLAQRFEGETPQGIFDKTGVWTRHVSAPGHIGSDMGLQAGSRFFEEHDIDPSSIDYFIFCTEYNDHCAPTTSSRLAYELNLPRHCGTMDMPMGCNGFINGLGMAKGLIESGQANRVLFITAETTTKVIHPNDLHLVSLFGDGGACTLIEAVERPARHLRSVIYGQDGSGYEHMIVHHSGAREPITSEWLDLYKAEGGLPWGKMHMNGMRIFTFALRVVPALVRNILARETMTMDDIDQVIFHQANGYLLEVLRKKLDIPKEKFVVAMRHCGNTVSSTMPIAYHQAVREGQLHLDSKVLMVGFGIGFTWGATILG